MRLTEAQAALLNRISKHDDAMLMNSDECSPSWWLEGSAASVHARTAQALVEKGMVELCAKWGGHPGLLGFRLSDAGRAALKEMENTDV